MNESLAFGNLRLISFDVILSLAPKFGNLANAPEVTLCSYHVSVVINFAADAMAGELDSVSIFALKVNFHVKPCRFYFGHVHRHFCLR